MLSLSKILLPVDFSERSVGAARYSRMLATRSGCEVVLLHVVTPAQFQFSPLDPAAATLPELYRTQLEQIQRDLADLQESILAGIRTRPVVLEGDPAARIVESAHREEAGLIVMPTHGYGPFRRFILGSNTAKVLHDADCPVWTGVHLTEAGGETLELRHILCAVDLGVQTPKVLAWANWLCSLFGARLTVMHATAAIPESGDHTEDAWRANLRWRAEKELQRVRDTASVPAELLVESGDPAHTICAAAARLKSSVLVIGRGSAAGVFGRLRTNAYAIIRQSPCPVVSV